MSNFLLTSYIAEIDALRAEQERLRGEVAAHKMRAEVLADLLKQRNKSD